jgi:hypothetical protein
MVYHQNLALILHQAFNMYSKYTFLIINKVRKDSFPARGLCINIVSRECVPVPESDWRKSRFEELSVGAITIFLILLMRKRMDLQPELPWYSMRWCALQPMIAPSVQGRIKRCTSELSHSKEVVKVQSMRKLVGSSLEAAALLTVGLIRHVHCVKALLSPYEKFTYQRNPMSQARTVRSR